MLITNASSEPWDANVHFAESPSERWCLVLEDQHAGDRQEQSGIVVV